jgi:hypothetical protein
MIGNTVLPFLLSLRSFQWGYIHLAIRVNSLSGGRAFGTSLSGRKAGGIGLANRGSTEAKEGIKARF